MPDARLRRTREAYPRGSFSLDAQGRLPAMWTRQDTDPTPPRLTLADDPPNAAPVSWQSRWYTIRLRRRLTWREWWLDLRYLVGG